ncbi:hypothetical protein [uncultured Phenylobacterium sp.]|uniref:hypothetical protein n=1 Tax=uncultured Phenylobacterium sp. TaxID=349273 RepID=UPI0025FF9F71|nr:hypothetical protein [uncultured Phenylobacterium sp.]
MKMQLLAVALLATGAVAAPSLAQGTFSPGKPKAPWTAGTPRPAPTPGYTPAAPKTYGVPQTRIYGAPEPKKPEPFKPYEPYKPKSVFGPDKR